MKVQKGDLCLILPPVEEQGLSCTAIAVATEVDFTAFNCHSPATKYGTCWVIDRPVKWWNIDKGYPFPAPICPEQFLLPLRRDPDALAEDRERDTLPLLCYLER